jgi:hypothetical protein
MWTKKCRKEKKTDREKTYVQKKIKEKRNRDEHGTMTPMDEKNLFTLYLDIMYM